MSRVTFLSGGVGGARFAYALDAWNRRRGRPLEITAIVNVGDDFTHLGLHVSPDIDSVMSHLAGLGDPIRGWGRAGDTFHALTEVRRIMPEAAWFQLGDLDLAHNMMRTHLLAQGLPLSRATALLGERYGLSCTILPVTDDPSPTKVVFGRPAERTLDFQEWWVRDGAEPLPDHFAFPSAHAAAPAPGVLDAIAQADLIVIAPSNPVVSIRPILHIPGVLDCLQNAPAPVVGVSPIIKGRPVRGWADRCLQVLGLPCTAAAVAELYGSRSHGGVLDAWLAAPGDDIDASRFSGKWSSERLLFTHTEEDDAIIDAVLDHLPGARESDEYRIV